MGYADPSPKFENDAREHGIDEAIRRATAERAGRAWAEREADAALDDETIAANPVWLSSERDAIPLVADDDPEGAQTLAEICNAAAKTRWNEIVEEAERRLAGAEGVSDSDARPGVRVSDRAGAWRRGVVR